MAGQNSAGWDNVDSLFQQGEKLVPRQTSTLDDTESEASPQISVVPGDDYARVVRSTPENYMASRLVVYLETCPSQYVHNLRRRHGWQTRH